MGSDDFFKKRKAELKARKREQLTPRVNSFLIVSEGEKTEPFYFEGIAKTITDSYGEGISVKKPIIDTCGEGKCTVSLVNAAVSIAKKAIIQIVYYVCIVQDATACCAQGLEFALSENRVYPDDYPDPGSEITVIGTFDTYSEEVDGNTYKYLVLKDARLV